MSMSGADTFRLPLYDVTLRKARSDDGTQVVRFSGVVSTDAPDLDGEVVKQDGIDFSYFDKQGFFRWHHTPKPDEGPDDPNAYVGKPLRRKVVRIPGGFRGTQVEGEFFDSPLAADIAEQQERMAKAGRSFGFSLEGKTVQRKCPHGKMPCDCPPEDKKIILRSRVHNIAIDPNPVNTLTGMDLRKALDACGAKPSLHKGEGDDPDDWPPESEDDETETDTPDADGDGDDLREGLDAGALAPIAPESLSGGRARGRRRGRKTMDKKELKAALEAMSPDDRADLFHEFGHDGDDGDEIRKAMAAHDYAMEDLSKALGMPRGNLSGGVASLVEGVDDLRKALVQRVDMDDAVAEHLIHMGGLVTAVASRLESLEKSLSSRLEVLGRLDVLEPIAKALRLPGTPTGVTSVTEIKHPAGDGGQQGERLAKSVASERLLAARTHAHNAGNTTGSEMLRNAIAEVSGLPRGETVPAADVERLCKAVGA